MATVVTLESIDDVLKEFDIETQDQIAETNEFFGILDNAAKNGVKAPESIDDLDDFDFS